MMSVCVGKVLELAKQGIYFKKSVVLFLYISHNYISKFTVVKNIHMYNVLRH